MYKSYFYLIVDTGQGVSNSIIGNGISMSIGGSPVEASELFGVSCGVVDCGVLFWVSSAFL